MMGMSHCHDRDVLTAPLGHSGNWRWMSSMLARAATSITFVCCNKIHLLSWQKYACHDETFVTTNNYYVCWDKIFLLWQNCCCDMCLSSFVMTKGCYVVTNMCMSWQFFCRDKIMFVVKNICRDKTFVARKNIFFAISILLSRQKLYLRQLRQWQSSAHWCSSTES